jgi:hypothetical protein
MRKILNALSAFCRQFELRDLHAYGGLVLIFGGVCQISVPMAMLVVGAAIFWLGVRR